MTDGIPPGYALTKDGELITAAEQSPSDVIVKVGEGFDEDPDESTQDTPETPEVDEIEDVNDRMEQLTNAEPVNDDDQEASDDDQDEIDVDQITTNDREIDPDSPDLIAPQTHELGANLLFADPDDELSPYHAIRTAVDDLIDLQGSDEPLLEDVCGSDWLVPDGRSLYWTGQIAAENEDYEAYSEYQIPLVARAASETETRKISIQFRPSLPDAETVDGDDVGLPDDLPYGVRVKVQSANVELDEILPILQAAVDALGIRRSYFQERKIHEWSRIFNYARYVRLDRHISEDRIVGSQGVLERLADFGRQHRGRGEHKWDHEEIVGHMQSVAFDVDTWQQLLPDRNHAYRIKSYHMKNPESEVGSTTSHPKLEIQRSGEYDDGSIAWADRDKLRHDATETLLSVLRTADVGLSPSDPAYVADDHFLPAPTSLDVEPVDMPIDELEEAEKDLATARLLDADLSDTEERVVETLTDGGGSMQYDQLADAADTSVSTVYRAIDKLGSIARSIDGTIELLDDVVRDQLSAMFRTIERSADMLHREASELIDDAIAGDIDQDSPWTRWLAAYGGSVEDLEPHEAPVVGGYGEALDWIRIDLSLGNWSESEIKRIMREGGLAAAQTSDSLIASLRKATVRYRDRDGEVQERPMSGLFGHSLRVGGKPVAQI